MKHSVLSHANHIQVLRSCMPRGCHRGVEHIQNIVIHSPQEDDLAIRKDWIHFRMYWLHLQGIPI